MKKFNPDHKRQSQVKKGISYRQSQCPAINLPQIVNFWIFYVLINVLVSWNLTWQFFFVEHILSMFFRNFFFFPFNKFILFLSWKRFLIEYTSYITSSEILKYFCIVEIIAENVHSSPWWNITIKCVMYRVYGLWLVPNLGMRPRSDKKFYLRLLVEKVRASRKSINVYGHAATVAPI